MRLRRLSYRKSQFFRRCLWADVVLKIAGAVALSTVLGRRSAFPRCELHRFDAMLKKPREFSLRKSLLWLGCSVVLASALYGFQKPWRLYISMEPYDNIALPADSQESSEFVFGRLMYPQHPNARFG